MSSVPLQFLCVGPQRTGTTWVYEMLRRHPEIYVPEAVKETMFFDRYYERGLDWYRKYYREAGANQLCGEVAPTYFDVPEVPARVHDVSPGCTIFITLRHPVERARSLFLHHLKKGRVSENFWEAADQKPRIIDAGRYAEHIPRWTATFGEDQLSFQFLEDIRNQPETVLHAVQDTLGVEHMDPPEKRNESINATSMPRFRWLAKGAARLTTTLHECGLHSLVKAVKKTGLKSLVYSGGEDRRPELSSATRAALIDEYEDDIAFLEKRTGRDLSHWRVP